MTILDGNKYRDELIEQYRNTVKKEKLAIKLAIIYVGDNPASAVYVGSKVKYAELAGMEAEVYKLNGDATTREVQNLISELNDDKTVTGIILQSPAGNVDFDACAGMIDPQKDIDGFTSINTFALYNGDELLLPCTVKGIIKLLMRYKIELKGKNVVIVGRGKIVGKPLAIALSNRDATVTLCHSKTENLEEFTKRADILISAVGKPGLITGEMVKEGFIGIDVGTTRVKVEENGEVKNKLKGDFVFDEVSKKASFITPVPGGVGPMTVACVIGNLLKAKELELAKQGKKMHLE